MAERIRYKNIEGQQFGYLIARKAIPGKKTAYWECECLACGGTARVRVDHLRKGDIKSCGCMHHDYKHGHTKNNKWTPTYSSWASMMRRCENPREKAYKFYGAVGIHVCAHWRIYENFLADMGERPPNTTLDRIDGTKGYEPGNCRWATIKEQANNTRRNALITYKGETMNYAQWSQRTGIPAYLIRQRIIRNWWPIEKALTEPHKI